MNASPLLREDYARRAAAAAAYREAAGITDPGQAIASEPHRGNPGAGRLGRDAWWHNRIGMPGRPVLVAEHRSLDPLRPLPAGAGGHRHR